jgi:hypothetical protein
MAAPRPAAPDPVPSAAPVDSRQAALLDSGELIVGSRLGLEAWPPDGTSHRTISAGPALHPRRFGHDYVLALRPLSGTDLRDGAVVELIALADGTRRELAQLPAFRCAAQSEAKPTHLDITDPLDFEVDSARRVGCLGVMDAAATSATVRVRARIDLSTARIERWLALGDPDCAAPEGVNVGDPAADGSCWRIPEVVSEQLDPSAFPFTFDNERVRMPAAPRGGSKLQIRGYERELTSPSKRWLVLAGDYTERESTYRRLVLFDRRDGRLFPLVEHMGAWPAPLKAAAAKLPTPIKQAQLVPKKADVRWLGVSEDSELLLLDRLVIRPERSAFEIAEGELAR